VRAQAASEFLLLSAFIFLLGAMIIILSYQYQQQSFFEKRLEKASDICAKIASEINMALKVGDSYKREFYIDKNIFSSNYSVFLWNYSIRIVFDNSSISCRTSIFSVNGIIKPGNNEINNTKGEIYVQ